jgi:hypothetical protein
MRSADIELMRSVEEEQSREGPELASGTEDKTLKHSEEEVAP